MKPTRPRYRTENSFFPFLKHLFAWIGGFIPQSPLFLLAYSDGLQDRVWLSSLAVGMWHSGNQWSLNEQVGEWQRKIRVSVAIIRPKGKQRDKSRGLRRCYAVFWVTEEWQSSHWSSWTKRSDRHWGRSASCHVSPHTSGGQPRGNQET